MSTSLSKTLLSALTVTLLLTGCGGIDAPPSTEVVAHTAAEAGIAQDLQLSGTLKAQRQTDVASRINGRVLSILVNKGDRVKTNDVLARLDTAVESAVLGGLTGTLRQAEAGLQSLIAMYDERIRTAEANITSLRATAAKGVNVAKVQEETSGGARLRGAKETLTNVAMTLENSLSTMDRLLLVTDKYADIGRKNMLAQHIGARDPSAVNAARQSFSTLTVAEQAFRTHFDAHLLTGDPSPSQIATGLDLAATALSAAKSALEEMHTVLQLSVTSRDFTDADLATQEQSVIRNGSTVESLLGAVRTLRETGIVEQSTAVREQTETQALQDIAQAERALEVLRREKETKIAEAQSSITRLQAEAGISAVQLNQTIIRAPFNGVVITKNVDPGAVVNPGTPLFTIADDSGFELSMNVPDSALSSLATGRSAAVNVDTIPGKTFDGEVLRIAPSADASSKNIEVDLRVENKSGDLKPGMFARVQFPLATASGVIIPAQAVLSRYGRDMVFVIENGHAVRRFVEIGARTSTAVAVLSGVAAGESVIAEGHHYLRDGDPVTVITEEPSVPSDAATSAPLSEAS